MWNNCRLSTNMLKILTYLKAKIGLNHADFTKGSFVQLRPYQIVSWEETTPTSLGVNRTMTTAARPTFEPARGGKGKGEGGDLSALSKQYSSRDLPGHTRMKYRSEEEDSSDDEDDTAELLAELNKIKKERTREKARMDAEKKVEDERIRSEIILKGNPLLNQDKTQVDFKVKRRWDDDVVFKNCAKGEEKKSLFINDTLRSEFHKKFMEKYVK
ncbi:CW15A-like protein [Mya arenaria]|uniref:CW15A-like protein n=1 Tax=Mya arenaria TaxID=6604 RepID=A0ABY7G3M5_MYAAR|nr:CW15A-like protein [Mya arenaria]